MMINMPHGASNTQMHRQMQQMQQQMQTQKSDHMPGVQLGAAEDVLMPMPLPLPTDVIGEIGAVISCNSGPKSNLSCGSTTATTGTPGGGPGAAAAVLNINMNVGMQCPGAQSASPSQNVNLLANSSEITGPFGNTANCGMMGVGVGIGTGGQTGDKVESLPQSGMTQMEWTKIQQQFFEDRLKGGKANNCRPSGIPGPG